MRAEFFMKEVLVSVAPGEPKLPVRYEHVRIFCPDGSVVERLSDALDRKQFQAEYAEFQIESELDQLEAEVEG